MSRVVRIKYIYSIVIAALYASLVWVFPYVSFGPWQIRIADILNPVSYILGFESVIGLTIGTLFANLISPFGVWDIIIGTACTFTYSFVNYILGRVFGYRKWMLPLIAVIDTLIIGLFIGVLLLSNIAGLGEGDPLIMFISVLPGSLITNFTGALILVPAIKKYVKI